MEVFRRPAVGRLDDIWGKAGRGYTDAVPSARRLTVVRQSKSSSSSSIGSHPGLGWRRRLVDRDVGAFALVAGLLALSAVIAVADRCAGPVPRPVTAIVTERATSPAPIEAIPIR